MLLVIWMFEAALPRTAEKAALRMRLPRTVTLCGAEHVDGVAVLPRAAGLRGGVLDAVVEHLRAVVARPASARPGCRCCRRCGWCCARSTRPRASSEKIAAPRAPVIGRAGDLAFDALRARCRCGRSRRPRNRGSRRRGRSRAGSGRAFSGSALPLPSKMMPESEDVVGAARDDQRRVVGRDDARRAGHADQPRAGRQHEARARDRRRARGSAAAARRRCGRSRAAAPRSGRPAPLERTPR